MLAELQRQIETLVARGNVTLAFPVETRVKTWQSISDKQRRRAIQLRSVTDLHDLCGLRVVTLFVRDAELVAEQVAAQFTVIAEEDTAIRLREDRFGYSSIHLVVTVPKEWEALPTFADLAGLRAEIQVRSVAQHLWATASHALQYKHEAAVPPPIRRSLARVSALLEVVDLELTRVVTERLSYRQTMGSSPTTVLNADNLESTLDSALPNRNKVDDEFYDDLLEELLQFEIDTPLKLRSLLRRHERYIHEAERRHVSSIVAAGEAAVDDEERALEKGVYFSHAGLVRIAMAAEFGDSWTKFQSEKSKYLAEHYPIDEEPDA